MAGMREIRERIASVSEIMKITNAMYLISSSNLKKAKKRLENTEPYFEKLQSTITTYFFTHLSSSTSISTSVRRKSLRTK